LKGEEEKQDRGSVGGIRGAFAVDVEGNLEERKREGWEDRAKEGVLGSEERYGKRKGDCWMFTKRKGEC
jgi:hypothetical protein